MNWLNRENKSGGIPYVINNGKIECLFMIPSNPNFGGSYPQIAKGHIERNELPREACIRELKEELGVVNYEIMYQLFTTNFKESRLHLYALKLRDKNNLIQPHYETKSVVWKKMNELSSLRPEQRNIINRAYKKIFIKEFGDK
jgi:ADP-ribose pyrophosphatase YjhB (NUDIX family)